MAQPQRLPWSAPQLSGVIPQGTASVCTPIFRCHSPGECLCLHPNHWVFHYKHPVIRSECQLFTFQWLLPVEDGYPGWQQDYVISLNSQFCFLETSVVYIFQSENLIYQHFLPFTFLIFSQVFIYLVWVPRTELMLSLVVRAFTHWAVFVVPVASPSLPCKPLLSPSFSLLFSSWDKVLRCSLDSLYNQSI